MRGQKAHVNHAGRGSLLRWAQATEAKDQPAAGDDHWGRAERPDATAVRHRPQPGETLCFCVRHGGRDGKTVTVASKSEVSALV